MSRNLIHRSPCVVHPKSSRLFADRVFTIRAESSDLAKIHASYGQAEYPSILLP